jgi:hypothetical protein
MNHEKEMKGLGWRVSLSIFCGIGWLVFLLLWLFFFASAYTIYQNIAIILLSLFVVGIVLGVPWTVYGLRFQSDKDREMWKTEGFKWRVWLSIIVGALFFIGMIYWFWFMASAFYLYQNIAILIVLMLIAGGIIAGSWASWGIKHGDKFD